MNTTWGDIRSYVRIDGTVHDQSGRAFRRVANRQLLAVDDPAVQWSPAADEVALLPEPPMPEPPDGTRLEFESDTTRYGAIREDSARSEWPGRRWLLYGDEIPVSWAAMWAMFGDALRTAVRLTPVAADLPKRELWPTVRYTREREERS